MKRTVVIAVGIVVIAGVLVWWSSAYAPGADRASVENELKDKGIMSDDGTITADAEFDAELNALSRELNAAEGEGGTELDAIGAIE